MSGKDKEYINEILGEAFVSSFSEENEPEASRIKLYLNTLKKKTFLSVNRVFGLAGFYVSRTRRFYNTENVIDVTNVLKFIASYGAVNASIVAACFIILGRNTPSLVETLVLVVGSGSFYYMLLDFLGFLRKEGFVRGARMKA